MANQKKTRKRNNGSGLLFDFHGAYTKKADAVAKEKKTKGAFIRTGWFASGPRYLVVTRRDNPRRVKNFRLDRFFGSGTKRVTFRDWDRAGDKRKVQAARAAGWGKAAPMASSYSARDLATFGPEWQARLMRGLQKTMKNPKPKPRKLTSTNPQESAATKRAKRQFKKFHGRAARKVTTRTVRAGRGLPKSNDVAKLGDLVELHIPAGVIAFPSKRPEVVTDDRGKRIYLLGGDQELNGLPKQNPEQGLVDLGECKRIVYYTRKAFDGFKPIEYDHQFGEEGGARPRLKYDPVRKQLQLVGGDYKIKDVGIVN